VGLRVQLELYSFFFLVALFEGCELERIEDGGDISESL
jgi:hypothetical protein